MGKQAQVVWDNEVGGRETGKGKGRDPSCTLNLYPALRNRPFLKSSASLKSPPRAILWVNRIYFSPTM